MNVHKCRCCNGHLFRLCSVQLSEISTFLSFALTTWFNSSNLATKVSSSLHMLPLGRTNWFLSLVSLPLLLHFKIKIFGQSLVPQVFLGSLGQSFAHLLASKDGHLESCISEFSKCSTLQPLLLGWFHPYQSPGAPRHLERGIGCEVTLMEPLERLKFFPFHVEVWFTKWNNKWNSFLVLSRSFLKLFLVFNIVLALEVLDKLVVVAKHQLLKSSWKP